MAAANPVTKMGSCKLQTFSCCLLNKKNHKSCKIPTKFQIPKSLSFGDSKSQSQSRLCNFPCSSTTSSSSSRFLVNYIIYEESPQVVLTVTILLFDEDGKLKQKLDDLIGNEIDAKKETDITLNEVVPLLLENASLWMNSRLMVSSNLKEAFLKLFKSEQMVTDKITAQNDDEEAMIAANVFDAVRCTEVLMDLCIKGVLDNKFKEIYTRDDLKGLLHHLTSIEGLMSASTLCLPGLVSREKGNELEGFSHATT